MRHETAQWIGRTLAARPAPPQLCRVNFASPPGPSGVIMFNSVVSDRLLTSEPPPGSGESATCTSAGPTSTPHGHVGPHTNQPAHRTDSDRPRVRPLCIQLACMADNGGFLGRSSSLYIYRNRQRQSDSMISVVATVIRVQLRGLVFVLNTKLHR